MSKPNIIGATFGESSPHDAEAVLVAPGVNLFDFVKVGEVLCQIADIKIQSDLGIDDAKLIAEGKKRTPAHNIVAKLDILNRDTYPIMPGSLMELASTDDIMSFLLENHEVLHHVHVGTLLRREDVGFYLGGWFLTQHLAILGMIGAGKSNAGKLILSQVNWDGIQPIVIDPHGEYKAGRQFQMDKFQVDVNKINSENVLERMFRTYPKEERIIRKLIDVVKFSFPVEITSAYLKACTEEYLSGGNRLKPLLQRAIMLEGAFTEIDNAIKSHSGTPLVFNMKGLSREDTQSFTKFIAETILKYGKEGKGYLVFIDEAQTFVPQTGDSECKAAVIDLIAEGRKFNCGVVLLSQRPARVDKDVLSQCNSKIILRLTNENDIRQVRASTEFSTRRMFTEVQKLRNGEALFVSSTIQRPVFIKVDKYEDKM